MIIYWFKLFHGFWECYKVGGSDDDDDVDGWLVGGWMCMLWTDDMNFEQKIFLQTKCKLCVWFWWWLRERGSFGWWWWLILMIDSFRLIEFLLPPGENVIAIVRGWEGIDWVLIWWVSERKRFEKDRINEGMNAQGGYLEYDKYSLFLFLFLVRMKKLWLYFWWIRIWSISELELPLLQRSPFFLRGFDGDWWMKQMKSLNCVWWLTIWMCGSGKERIFNYCDNSAQLLRFSGWKCVVGGQVSEKEDRKVLNKPNEIIFFLLLWRSLAAFAKDIYLWSWRVCGVVDWTVCDRSLNEYFAAAAALDK